MINALLQRFYEAGWKPVTSQEYENETKQEVIFREDGQWLQTASRLRYAKVRGANAKKSYTLRAAIEKALNQAKGARA